MRNKKDMASYGRKDCLLDMFRNGTHTAGVSVSGGLFKVTINKSEDGREYSVRIIDGKGNPLSKAVPINATALRR